MIFVLPATAARGHRTAGRVPAKAACSGGSTRTTPRLPDFQKAHLWAAEAAEQQARAESTVNIG